MISAVDPSRVPPDIPEPTRLDWLFLYHARLWKKPRLNLKEIYASLLTLSHEHKLAIGKLQIVDHEHVQPTLSSISLCERISSHHRRLPTHRPRGGDFDQVLRASALHRSVCSSLYRSPPQHRLPSPRHHRSLLYKSDTGQAHHLPT